MSKDKAREESVALETNRTSVHGDGTQGISPKVAVAGPAHLPDFFWCNVGHPLVRHVIFLMAGRLTQSALRLLNMAADLRDGGVGNQICGAAGSSRLSAPPRRLPQSHRPHRRGRLSVRLFPDGPWSSVGYPTVRAVSQQYPLGRASYEIRSVLDLARGLHRGVD